MPAFDKTLVLDLDKTLIYAEKTLERVHDFTVWSEDLPIYPVYKRPGLDEFLEFCFSTFDVGVWGQGCKEYVKGVCEELFKNYKLKFVWSRDECGMIGRFPYLKDVKKIEKNLKISLSSIIVVDDNPDHFDAEGLQHLVKAAPWDGGVNDDYLRWLPEFLIEVNKVSDVRKLLGDLARQ